MTDNCKYILAIDIDGTFLEINSRTQARGDDIKTLNDLEYEHLKKLIFNLLEVGVDVYFVTGNSLALQIKRVVEPLQRYAKENGLSALLDNMKIFADSGASLMHFTMNGLVDDRNYASKANIEESVFRKVKQIFEDMKVKYKDFSDDPNLYRSEDYEGFDPKNKLFDTEIVGKKKISLTGIPSERFIKNSQKRDLRDVIFEDLYNVLSNEGLLEGGHFIKAGGTSIDYTKEGVNKYMAIKYIQSDVGGYIIYADDEVNCNGNAWDIAKPLMDGLIDNMKIFAFDKDLDLVPDHKDIIKVGGEEKSAEKFLSALAESVRENGEDVEAAVRDLTAKIKH